MRPRVARPCALDDRDPRRVAWVREAELREEELRVALVGGTGEETGQPWLGVTETSERRGDN